MKDKIVRVLFVVFSFMLLYSSISILLKSIEQYKDDSLFQKLASETSEASTEIQQESQQESPKDSTKGEDLSPESNYSHSESSNTFEDSASSVDASMIPEKDENEEPSILPEYQELYSQNSDLYGWIKIDDSYIDFPVMYTPDNLEFYLRQNFYKEYSVTGTPFVEFPDAENVIIFGHNMKNKSMFSTLTYYKDINYWKEHKYIHFDTLYQKNTYEIIIVASGTAYYDSSEISDDAYLFYEHCYLNNAQEFEDYISNVQKTEYFDTGVSASYGDSLITLCTCDYIGKDSRLLIVAKKI